MASVTAGSEDDEAAINMTSPDEVLNSTSGPMWMLRLKENVILESGFFSCFAEEEES